MISKNVRIALFIAPAILIASVPARAADQPESAQYRNLLADAVTEYDARRFDEARALFRRANDLAPSARTLRGIGMASFELRDYVEAYRALQGALAEKHKALTPDQRRQVESLLDKTKAFTAHFGIRTLPLDSTVRIDGDVPFVEPDGRVTLGLGRHAISVDAAGRIPEVRDVHVFGGENRDLEFRLRLVEEPLPATPPEAHNTLPAPPADNGPHVSHPAWWFASGGALAVGAVIAGVVWHSQEGELEKCKNGGTTCVNYSTLESDRNWALGATIGLAAGAVGLGIVGAVLWTRTDKADAPPATASCVPSINFVSCRLLF
ncbi:MAG TPA: hypothetical protein VGL59_00125 [Polyangia bacterium]|jgi:hypothetical protein